ncbi:hypothetical protein PGB90_003650 [Kerria lacca]
MSTWRSTLKTQLWANLNRDHFVLTTFFESRIHLTFRGVDRTRIRSLKIYSEAWDDTALSFDSWLHFSIPATASRLLFKLSPPVTEGFHQISLLFPTT